MAEHPFQQCLARYPAEGVIFDQGDTGGTMFVVQSGRVRLFRTTGEDNTDLGIMEKGDFFGETSILEGLPRNCTAQALDDAELIEIDATTFERMVRGNMEIAVRLMRKLSVRARDAERRVCEMQIEVVDSGAPRAGATATTVSNRPDDAAHAGNSVAPESAGPCLVAEDGTKRFAIPRDESVIGRFDPVTESKPDIDLTEVDTKRSVSRRHARVVHTADGLALIEEVGVLNGTFINGARLSPGEPHPMSDGDEIGFGTVKMRFEG